MKTKRIILALIAMTLLSCTRNNDSSLNEVSTYCDTLIIHDTINVLSIDNKKDPEFFIVTGDTIMADDMNQTSWNMFLSEESQRKEKEVDELYNAIVKQYERSFEVEYKDKEYVVYAKKILARIKDSQKKWKLYINADAEVVSAMWEGGTGRRSAMCDHKIYLIDERIEQLQNWQRY